MAPARVLERNVRPARVADDEDEVESDVEAAGNETSSKADSSEEQDSSDEDQSRENGRDRMYDDKEEEGDPSDEVDVSHEIGNVSFGALVKAQDALSRKRKRGSETTADQEEKLAGIRARLQELRSGAKPPRERSSASKVNPETKQGSGNSRAAKTTTDDDSDFYMVDVDGESDSDSAPSEVGAASKSRSSKHAPTARSSKYQVTRKRTVVDVPKRVVRDPRFDALHQHSGQPGNSDKAYSFLRDYEKDEIAELKAAIKQTRNEDDKETLQRKVISMQNRIKSQEAKEREQEVVRRHRKEEKQMIEQGKKPFYLKRKDVKDQALVDKFKGMKGKDREKLMEKRRRKEGQKEKKRMPEARRVAG